MEGSMANKQSLGASATRRIQQREIANRAGVSISTVSRVLNNVSGISATLRQRVQAVALELGYAQALTPAHGLLHIGLIGGQQNPSRDPFNADIVSGIEEECRHQGIRLGFALLVNDGVDHRPDTRQQPVDGFLLLSVDDQSLVEYLLAQHLPLIAINAEYPDLPVDMFLPANEHGALLATRHLIQHGHRRILHLTHMNRSTIRHRFDGYQIGLREAGIPFDPALVVDVEMIAEEAYPMMQRLLARRTIDFTAIFCANDVTAIGTLRALHEAGLRVPEDISLVGYDDLPMTAFLAPPLTTVRIERKELGARAVRLLVERILQPMLTPIRVELAVRLIERQSVAPPRA
jgi:DNA-binding LacI/PurR family transcriptional regulator